MVLVVDDSVVVRSVLAQHLTDRGYEAVHACDGEEALHVCEEQRPDVMLLDVNMPKLNGFEVCRLLKSEAPTSDIKVVMLTARSTEADRLHGREVGADDYFIKPFSPVQLLNKVYALLE